MKKEFSKQAYTQAYSIVKFLLEIGEIVVPEDLLEVLEEKRNTENEFDLNDLKNVELNPDTEKILTIVYLNCIATKEDKNRINKATKLLKKVIINEEDRNFKEDKNSLPIDLNNLKWGEKIKIKFRKILSLKMQTTQRSEN